MCSTSRMLQLWLLGRILRAFAILWGKVAAKAALPSDCRKERRSIAIDWLKLRVGLLGMGNYDDSPRRPPNWRINRADFLPAPDPVRSEVRNPPDAEPGRPLEDALLLVFGHVAQTSRRGTPAPVALLWQRKSVSTRRTSQTNECLAPGGGRTPTIRRSAGFDSVFRDFAVTAFGASGYPSLKGAVSQLLLFTNKEQRTAGQSLRASSLCAEASHTRGGNGSPCRNVRTKRTKRTKSAPALIPRWFFPQLSIHRVTLPRRCIPIGVSQTRG
jgi:hypothetical protein